MKFTYASGERPLEGYTLQTGIGRGGFGEVYQAVSDGGKEVALKLVQRHLNVELRGVGQCLNLKHPHLVALYDVKQAGNGDFWVVMEHVAGDSLDKVIERQPQGMPPEEALAWLRGICAGVGYLHERGIVHRDLKPGNLFIENGVVKIGDYGLSKFISASRRSGQTESIGTVHYMAPEIANGRYGKEIDLYAVGVILYEMLTGHVPFDGETSGEVLMKHLTAAPDLGALPPAYRPVVARLLDKDPGRRFPSAQALLGDLKEVDRLPSGEASAAPGQASAAPHGAQSPPRETQHPSPHRPVPVAGDGGEWGQSPARPFCPSASREKPFVQVVEEALQGFWAFVGRLFVATFFGTGIALLAIGFANFMGIQLEAAVCIGLGAGFWFGALTMYLICRRSERVPRYWRIPVTVALGAGVGLLVAFVCGVPNSHSDAAFRAILLGLGSGFLTCGITACLFFLTRPTAQPGNAFTRGRPLPAAARLPVVPPPATQSWHPGSERPSSWVGRSVRASPFRWALSLFLTFALVVAGSFVVYRANGDLSPEGTAILWIVGGLGISLLASLTFFCWGTVWRASQQEYPRPSVADLEMPNRVP
jgi:hypothetical protein